MRNFSKQVKSTYYKFQSLPRNFTQEKRLQELHTLKDSEVKVGIYKYSTDDELGKGYSSKVYKGVEIEKLHKRYAIKVIELKKFRGSNLEMLEAEIQIHRNLVHENVLRLHEVIKTPYFYYLILEYCPHGNLHEYIRQKKKLTQANSIDIMNQVLAGYRYLIEQGVIHRDLKPANILRIGNKWKISDFGFAVKSKYGFKDRINVGTPLYMPPESLKKSYYSSKTDIFALGIIEYEMVEGRTPWQCSNQKELLDKMKEEITVPATVKLATIREFITRCCQLNENKRMSREELLQFQLVVPPTTASRSHVPMSDRESLVSNSNPSSQVHSKRPSMIGEPLPNEQDWRQNGQKLKCEFLLTQHIHSCLRNMQSFLIEPQTRQIFSLSLFKLLLRLIRFLCDRKTNILNLKNWTQYQQSKIYSQLYQQMLHKSQLYEKEYLEQIKHHDIKIIRCVNRKFPDLCHNAPISEKFYENFKEFLVPILRNHNHETMVIMVEQEETEASYAKTDVMLKPEPEQETSKAEYRVVSERKDSHFSSQSGKGFHSAMKGSQKQEVGQQLFENSNKDIHHVHFGAKSQANEAAKYTSKQISRQTSKQRLQVPNSAEIENISRTESNQQYKLQEKTRSKIEEKESKPMERKDSRQQSQVISNISSKKDLTNKEQPAQSAENPPITLHDKFQALQSLYTLYRVSDLRSHPQNRDLTLQKIKVVTNYLQSTMKKADYLDIRRLLRSL